MIASEEATKIRYGPDQAKKLLKNIDRVIAVRGKNVVSFDMKKSPPDDATLMAHLIGPTGNLRAPTMKIGKTLLVGFNEEAYREVFGS